MLTEGQNGIFTGTPQHISIEILTENFQLMNFRDEWFEFWKTNPYHHPFNSPDWVIPWWKYFGNDKPLLLIFRVGYALSGCIPFYIHLSAEGERQLKLIGTGNSDYLEVLLSPEYSVEIISMINHLLNSSQKNYDVCYINGQGEQSNLLKYFRDNSDKNIIINKEDVSPVADLPGSFEEYINTLPVQFRKNTLRAKRKLSSLNYELLSANSYEVSEYLDKMIELHNREWNLRGQNGVLYDLRVQKFIMEVIGNFLSTGNVKLYALKNYDHFAAINIIFEVSASAYYYIGSMNVEFSKFSPGSVILLSIIEDCINRGISRFDFLRGAEEYKYKWGAKDTQIYQITIKNGT